MAQEVDHRDVVARLPAGVRRELCEQFDSPGLVRIGIQLGLVLVCGSYIQFEGIGWPMLLIPQGILLIFLFTALHESIHYTAFRTRALNDWVARICGFLVILGPTHFRHFHLAHHRFTHDPLHDPELTAAKPGKPLEYLVYLSGISDWIWRIRTLLRNAFGRIPDPFVPSRARARIRRESLVFLGGYAAFLIFFWPVAIWSWLLPLLMGGPFLRAFLLAEHGRCPHVANMLLNTRTTFTNALVRWLAWNMPYHVEHHAYPAVPFHNLPRFHDVIRQSLKQTERGYTRFNTRYFSATRAGILPDTPGRG